MGVSSHGKCLVHVDGDVDMICFTVHVLSTFGQLTTRAWTRRTTMYPLRSVHKYIGLNSSRYIPAIFSSWPACLSLVSSLVAAAATAAAPPPTRDDSARGRVGVTTESRDIARQKRERWRPC